VSPDPRLAAIIALRLVGVCALLALPCAARSALGPRYGGELEVAVRSMPATLEPGAGPGAARSLLSGLVHETLVGIDADGLPVPALAQAWTAAADGREWRLTLRELASFHDGRAVTSDDAVASLRRFLGSRSPAAAWLAAALDRGAPITAPDPGHLVLRFAEPRALPLAPLAAPGAAVTGARGAGCGPFSPLTPAPGKRIRLTAFPGHIRGRPYLDAIGVVAAAGDALQADFGSGRLDVVPGVPGGDGPSSLSAILILALDASRPPFDDVEARATVSSVLDRADIVRRLLPGGEAASSLLVPGLLPPMEAYAHRRGAALDASVRMAVDMEVPPLVSQRIVASLGAVGLRVDAVAVPPYEALKAPGAARLFLWSPEVPEPGLALHELAALAPRVAAVEEALAAASRERDLDRRRAVLHAAEAALREEDRLIPVASVPVSFRARPGVHGLRVDLTGRLVLEDAWREP
jgi:MarR-like DNA-binding transcriptional regulator SgrR of sgrS sRNA